MIVDLLNAFDALGDKAGGALGAAGFNFSGQGSDSTADRRVQPEVFQRRRFGKFLLYLRGELRVG